MKIIDQFSSLPVDWQFTPLKAVCDFAVSNVDKHSLDGEIPVRLCNYTDVYKNEQVSTRMELMRATATSQEIERFQLKVGDVVITKDSESWDDIGIPAFVSETEDDFICGYHLALIRPNRSQIDGQFLFRCMQSRVVAVQLELEATGVTRFGLPKESIGSALLPLPPIETQRRIADYLDRETGRIDALIAAKEKLLALLAEKRAALISQLVTRGLDPNVEMKPSGLEWVGEIPKHWEVLPLKYFAEVGSGSTPPTDNPDYWAEEGIPWVNSSSVNQLIIKEPNRFITNLAIKDCYIPIKQPPAVLVGLIGQGKTRGKAALLGIEVAVGQNLAFIKPRDNALNATYLSYLLQPVYDFMRGESSAVGGAQGAITCEQLNNMKVLIPPENEQNRISLHIERKLAFFEPLQREARRSITLLRERRAALISAAVCGQLSL